MSAILIGDDLRAVMRHVPSPVVVVTFLTSAGAKGITIGSFTSVSLDPALISFNVMHTSTMHDALMQAERFAVQILRDDQVDLSERFSIPDLNSNEQFGDVPHRVEGGLPLIDGVLATLRCRPFNVIQAGDHSLIIGEVIEIDAVERGAPLLYYQQSYRKIGVAAEQ